MADVRAPLADRMRPRTLDEIVGQDHIVGMNAPFRKALDAGRLRSVILWGPPGTGKTTLARCLAEAAGFRLVQLSAVLSGTKDLREIIESRPALDPRPTLLFVDEIHRWNKAQQDALLPHVECGVVTLVGATTENPAFQLIPALRSRTELLILERLTHDAIASVLRRAARLDGIELPDEVCAVLARAADGDARRALSMLERLHDRGPITNEALAALDSAIFHDRDGDAHHDVVSAFIKSMRGSSPDGALYWMARMLEGGEDPMFVARRMVIFASEDIGNAEPRAITLAVSVMEGVARIGMPQARILLAQACAFLATAPKSNASYTGVDAAIAAVRESGALPVPNHLRNAPTTLAKSLGHGAEYQYPHDFPDHIVDAVYLPHALGGRQFYVPSAQGAEKTIRDRLAWWARRLSERLPERE